MKLKKIKPTTNGTRHQINLNKNLLSKKTTLLKKLLFFKPKTSGRSRISGHITSWHKGRGAKNFHRLCNSNFIKKNSQSIIISVEYNPKGSSFNTLNFDLNKKTFFNTKHIRNARVGSLVNINKNKKPNFLGNFTSLSNLPAGSTISNITIKSKAVFTKSAGTQSQLLSCVNNFAKLKLPSKKIINISGRAQAFIGANSNINNKLTSIGKAGRNRLKGRRPIVRGIAMNPVDHPHGGRANGGRPSVTPWGLPTKSKFSLKKNK